jgi:hypothetical protein
MAGSCFEFGAHTVNHVVLTLEDRFSAEREIVESRAALENGLGRPVKDFAYPNGWYSAGIISLLVKAGYRSAVTTEDLLNRIGGDPFSLKRKVLGENFSMGINSEYSSCLTGCQLDGVFDTLGLRKAVRGSGAGLRNRLLEAPEQSPNQLTGPGTVSAPSLGADGPG